MKYVHIAGTNGKGSVAEYIYQIIMAAGESCGCFTSPHLVSPTERFRANGEEINAVTLNELLNEVESSKLAVNGSLFAAYTAAALLWFGRLVLDYAVLETGLGGRLDPTNVVTPAVSVITSIGFDHMALLGETIEKIASEKAGIIKSGVPVFSARQLPEAEDVISAVAKSKNAPFYFVPDIKRLTSSLEGQTFVFEGRQYHIRGIGQMQPEAAALAALAAREMGFSEEAIRVGLRRAVIPCRAQFFRGSPDILLDGAHNAASVQALCKTLDEYFASEKKVLLFACMKEKDVSAMAAYLSPYFHEAVVTSIDYERGADPAKLEALFSQHMICRTESDPLMAFAQAKRLARKTQSMLVICGSFYLTGMIYGMFTHKQ
jgi:dihydrofolate synthase/folylpolyglutamate synthase